MPPRAADLEWKSDRHFSIGLLFERFNMTNLLRIRAVCREWRTVAETLLRARRTVKFFNWQGDDDNFRDELFAHLPRLESANPDPASSAFIVRLLPNIISVHMPCLEKWQAQTLLLLLARGWGGQLEQLTICGFPRNKALVTKLVTAIFHKLPRLRALGLYGLSDKITSVQLPNRLPVLSRLETLKLFGFKGDLTPVLTQLGPPICRMHINTEQADQINISMDTLEAFFEEHPAVGAQLTGLDLVVIPDEPERLWNLICERFTELVTLRACFLFGCTFDHTLPAMVRLTKLRCLYFNVDLKKGPYPAIAHLEPFSNVRVLLLGAVADPSFDIATFRSTIGRLFPNLEDLRISTFSPNAMELLASVVKRIFPCLKKQQIGLANRSKMSVGVQKRIYED